MVEQEQISLNRYPDSTGYSIELSSLLKLTCISASCRRPHRGAPKKPPPSLKETLSRPPPPSSAASKPPSTVDALRDDADTTFDLPSFQDFAGLKGSAFRESIETLEEMANREPDFEPFHDDIGTYVPSVHPSDTLFGSEPRENGRKIIKLVTVRFASQLS